MVHAFLVSTPRSHQIHKSLGLRRNNRSAGSHFGHAPACEALLPLLPCSHHRVFEVLRGSSRRRCDPRPSAVPFVPCCDPRHRVAGWSAVVHRAPGCRAWRVVAEGAEWALSPLTAPAHDRKRSATHLGSDTETARCNRGKKRKAHRISANSASNPLELDHSA